MKIHFRLYQKKKLKYFKNIGNSDITHNINFYLFKKIISKIGGLKEKSQHKKILIKMGIKKGLK